MMKKIAVALILCLASCGGLPSFDFEKKSFQNETSRMSTNAQIVFFDVGQGDSILIQSENESMLVDTGVFESAQNTVLPYIEGFGLNLKYILITHYHKDHFGGVFPIVAGLDGLIGTADDNWPSLGFIDRGGEDVADNFGYEEYEELTQGKRKTANAGDSYIVGDITVEVVAENSYVGEERAEWDEYDENASSVVLLVKFGEFECLLTGDVTGGGGNEPYNTPDVESLIADKINNVDCLKVAHHGSKTSTNEYFVGTLNPKISIISVGDENDYGHPHEQVISRLVENGSRVVMTQQGSLSSNDVVEIANGNIIIDAKNNGDFVVIY